MEQLKAGDIKWQISTSPPTSTPTRLDQSVVENGNRLCKVPDNVTDQLLCNRFLYNSIQTHCTFKRFDYGVCDYTPEGYDNIVKFNANARKMRGK